MEKQILKLCSGKEAVKILCNKFGFEVKRIKGDHAVMVKEDVSGKLGIVIPLHREVKLPTLRNALKLAKVSEEEFAKFQ